MVLGKYSMGIGDRFAHQGKAQLQAIITAKEMGLDITPVWNKSHREHMIIHTDPQSAREEADAAVRDLDWSGPYHVDADHINLGNVDLFVKSSDYFTLDVADAIGQSASQVDADAFARKYAAYAREIAVLGLEEPLCITQDQIADVASKYLLAAQEAGRLYRHIEQVKGAGNFITEVSMDETEAPQTQGEMLFILAALADEGVPAQTIAPKFAGRFNKGVDYVGDVEQFAAEFEADLAVIAFAIHEFGLPQNLKLSVHSGSDKFSIYGPMHEAIQKFDAGLHIKTAGTTWLEELIGLASAGDDGLDLAKEIYRESLGRYDELCGPYAAVIDIHPDELPKPDTVSRWGAQEFVSTLRHDLSCPNYNPSFRQLLHVGYKVAAQMEERYLDALDTFENSIARNVTENILERHLKPVFMG